MKIFFNEVCYKHSGNYYEEDYSNIQLQKSYSIYKPCPTEILFFSFLHNQKIIGIYRSFSFTHSIYYLVNI